MQSKILAIVFLIILSLSYIITIGLLIEAIGWPLTSLLVVSNLISQWALKRFKNKLLNE
jgi:hypothetical protein